MSKSIKDSPWMRLLEKNYERPAGYKVDPLDDTYPELEKAEKDGNTYVFQNLSPEAYGRYKIWFENGGSREAGFMTFLNEKEAAHYFEVMEKVSGYTFPWHVEEKPAE